MEDETQSDSELGTPLDLAAGEEAGRFQQAHDVAAPPLGSGSVHEDAHGLDGFGCVAIIIVTVMLGVAFIAWQRGPISETVRSFAASFEGPPVAVEIPLPTATVVWLGFDPSVCPTAEAVVCQPWPENEVELRRVYAAEVMPVALNLLSVADGYESLNVALRQDGRGVVRDEVWLAFARRTQAALETETAILANTTVPGSIAGTHARLASAAGLLWSCAIDWTEAINSTFEYNALFCTNDSDGALAIARIHLEIAIADLGAAK